MTGRLQRLIFGAQQLEICDINPLSRMEIIDKTH
jgi:hypothetical protein